MDKKTEEQMLRMITGNNALLVDRVVRLEHTYNTGAVMLPDGFHDYFVRTLSEALLNTVTANNLPGKQTKESGTSTTPAMIFGISEGRSRRNGGLPLGVLVTFMKLYRRCFLDLTDDRMVDPEEKDAITSSIHSFFDTVERGICDGWTGAPASAGWAGPDTTTTEMCDSQYILDHITGAIILLNRSLEIENLNRSGYALLSENNQINPSEPKGVRLPWLDDELHRLLISKDVAGRFEKELETKNGLRVFSVECKRVPDDSRQYAGFVLVINDITDYRNTEKGLRVDRQRFYGILEHAPIGIMLTNNDGNVVYINARFNELFGYTLKDLPENRSWFRLAFPDQEYRNNAVTTWQTEVESSPGKLKNSRIFHITTQDGSVKICRTLMVRLNTGEFISTFEDITEQVRVEKALGESENKFQTLVEQSIAGVYIIQDGAFIYVNRKFAEIHGYTVDEILNGIRPADLVLPEDYPISAEYMRKRLSGEIDSAHFSFRIIQKDKSIAHLDIYGSRMNYRGRPAIIGTLVDITDRITAESTIRQLAYYDTLTSLPNRALLHDRLAMAIATAKRNKQKMSLIMLDLDKFKDINDTFGYDIGDEVLRTTARTIEKILRRSDTVARISGDAFMVMLPETKSREDSISVAEKILESFQEPLSCGTYTIHITPSIGITIFPEDGNDMKTLLKNTDIAMYRAKDRGRNQIVIFGNSARNNPG